MTTLSQDRPLGTLIVDAATEPFWNAAKEGVLRIKRCTACARVHWYPRALCPFCLGDTEWVDASGLGTVYSVSVTRRAGPLPYAIAYVALDEGVTMLTNIVDCDLDTVRIGDRVQVCFKPAEGGYAVPMFAPAGAG
uniref:Zn-ribbon domain-containing OB-fold protein n=1 Tax=unclassified Variovorax TaxID=663243 RepID=UPI000D367130